MGCNLLDMRKVINFLLAPLEGRKLTAAYKPSQRKVLLIISILFSGLATSVFIIAPKHQLVAYFPVLVFGSLGCYGLLAAIFASDQAVANLWNS